MAGGLTDSAYQQQATLARTEVINGSKTEHTYMDVDLRQALSPNSSANPTLTNNDQLFIRTATNWHMPWTVTVNGRVPRPGIYPIREGETLDELLDKCVDRLVLGIKEIHEQENSRPEYVGRNAIAWRMSYSTVSQAILEWQLERERRR